MTVSAIVPLANFLGNGATTVFPYTFWIQKEGDYVVYTMLISTGDLTQLVAGVDYEITGVGLEPPGGGDVTTLWDDPLAATHRLLILRTTPLTQDLDITDQDGFNPVTLEFQLDRFEHQIQELSEGLGRALKVKLGQTISTSVDNLYLTDGEGGVYDVGDINYTAILGAGAAAAAAAASAAAAAASAATLVRKSIWSYAGATHRDKVNAFIVEANGSGGNVELHFDHNPLAPVIDLRGGPLTEITGRNVSFDGHGHLIIMNPTGNTFRYGNGSLFCFGGRIKNFEFYWDPGDTVTVDAIAVRANYVRFLEVSNIVMSGGAGLFDGTSSILDGVFLIHHIFGSVKDIAGAAFIRRGQSVALNIHDVHIGNSWNIAGNTAEVGRYGILDAQTVAGSYSALMLNNVFLERFYTGVFVYAGTSVFNIDYYFNNIVIDGCYKYGLWMLSDSGGTISNIQMNNAWFNTVISTMEAVSYGALISCPAGGGRIGLIDMAKCFITGGKTADLAFVGRICEININGLRSYTYETPDATKIGVLFDNTLGVMQNVNLSNSQIEVDTLLTSFEAAFGVYVAGATPIEGLNIQNNNIGGSTTQLVLPAYVINNTIARVKNNVYSGTGARPGGWKAGGAYVIAATTVDWTNFQPQCTHIFIHGGTVTVVTVTDVNGTKVTVKAGTDINFILEPGEKFSITYSVAPTVLFKVLE